MATPSTFGEKLGKMYQKWVLDCIPNLAYAVSVDFSKRPALYDGVSDVTAKKLTELQSRWGHSENYPDDEDRSMLMDAFFGTPPDKPGFGNDDSIFRSSRMPVLAAAADFSGAEEATLPIHRARIIAAILPFQSFMKDLNTQSFKQTEPRMQAIFDEAQSILKDKGIATVFGCEQPNADFPFKPDFKGAKLIEQITTQLPNTLYGVISSHQFMVRVQIGLHGGGAMSFIIDKDIETIPVTDDDLDPLIGQLYTWGSVLGLVGGATPQPEIARVQPPYPTVNRTRTA